MDLCGAMVATGMQIFHADISMELILGIGGSLIYPVSKLNGEIAKRVILKWDRLGRLLHHSDHMLLKITL